MFAATNSDRLFFPLALNGRLQSSGHSSAARGSARQAVVAGSLCLSFLQPFRASPCRRNLDPTLRVACSARRLALVGLAGPGPVRRSRGTDRSSKSSD